MEKDIYVVSKPLQYFNVRNIVDPERHSHKTLIILGFFIDSAAFTDAVRRHDTLWDEVIYLKSKRAEYFYLLRHRCARLYVELDASFILGILSSLGCFRQLYIYEEGYGSYRRDRWGEAKGVKKCINQYTGVAERVTGFSRFLTGQYLYLPALYRDLFPGYDKPLYPFRKTFLAQLHDERELFLKLSEGYDAVTAIHNQKVALYLTTHQINTTILEEILQQKSAFDVLFVKPHPHLRDLSIFEKYKMNLMRSNMMVEYLIDSLLENGNDLTVYHENSTGVIWFQDKIHDRNMGTSYSEYQVVSSYVRDILGDKLA